jgi:hypothetical protein
VSPSFPVLLVAYVLQPSDVLPANVLLNGRVRHSRRRRRAMPVLLARWNPNDVGGPDVFDRIAPALDASRARP